MREFRCVRCFHQGTLTLSMVLLTIPAGEDRSVLLSWQLYGLQPDHSLANWGQNCGYKGRPALSIRPKHLYLRRIGAKKFVYSLHGTNRQIF